ncbi:hypothetical protein [Brevundimonas sp. CEF1]|uniref:hypothetical protein n=1 Tax=Brevundimonas sp. CEF1 TaxID=3442642 RepID=UPI003F515D64
MSRYKGQSKKGAIDAADLREVADCYRRVTRIHASLNPVSDQIFPLMAASATLKACWAELSGAGGMAWTYPGDGVPLDGLAPGADRSGKPREATHMYRFDLDDRPAGEPKPAASPESA